MHQLTDKKNKIILYISLLFILSTTSGKFLENKKNYSSKVNQINIKGLSDLDNLKIYNELNSLFSQNILMINKHEVQKIINNYNIIEEYSIKKIYPSTLNINIKPTKFVARLSSNDQLVGANGKLIDDKKNNETLPYIFGKFNSQDFLKFKKNIIKSEFTLKEFKTLYFFPSNRWDILTNDNILIKLPNYNILNSLNLAYKIINNENFNNKNLIDLRIYNYLIVK
jgi:cell division protein FtsQ